MRGPAWSPDSERLAFVRNGGTVAGDRTFAYARAGGIPDRERTIDQGMGFTLHTVGRGGGAPRPVRIDGYEWAEPTGSIEVRVNDADGEPIRSSGDAAYFVARIDANIERLRGMDSCDDPAQCAPLP